MTKNKKHNSSKVGPYRVESYTDKKGQGHVVTKGENRNPHTHEIVGTDHADLTLDAGSKMEKEQIIKNDAFWLQD